MNQECAASARVRRALAEAVSAQPTGWRLGPDNRSLGRSPVADLVADDAPFAVTPRAALLAVDLDLAGLSGPAAAARRAAFDRLTAAAHHRGVPHVLVASGRPGHRHAFFVVGDGGPDRVTLEAACRAAGLDVRGRGIRPPLAAHRTGGRAELLFPASPEQALAALRTPPPAQAATLLAGALGARLSTRLGRALRAGHAAAGYTSASEARMALAVQLAGRGLGVDDLARLLESPRTPLGETFRARPARWRARELTRLWAKATGWVAAHPDPPRTERPGPGRLTAAAAAAAWPGMAGASDLAVLEVLLHLARRLGRVVVGASLPDLAVGAGLSVDTARTAVRRLAAAGWLEIAEEATATAARTYRLLLPDGADVPDDVPDDVPADVATSTGDPVGDGAVWSDLGADVGRWGALGKSALRVARLLGGRPVDVPFLADRLRCSRNAVRIHLRRLAEHGVAARVAGGWALTGADPDRVAAALGVAGRRAAARAELVALRAARAELRASWRRAVSRLRAAFDRTDEASWQDAAAQLPARVVAVHAGRWRRVPRSGPPPAFAA